MTATNTKFLTFAASATATQQAAYFAAAPTITESDGGLLFAATGTTPSVDIPIVIRFGV
jgi:hypothetical protein